MTRHLIRLIWNRKRQNFLLTVEMFFSFLTLFGVVRTRDIAPNNVVPSTAIANMQVQLDGKGVVSDHLNPGWLYRVLTKVWPF